MPQLNKSMPSPKPTRTIHAQLASIAQQCGLEPEEFSIVEDSVLIDGEAMLKRNIDVSEVVFRLTEPYVGVTVVLPGLKQRDSSFRNLIAAAGGSCYFRTASESFEQTTELASVRMRSLHSMAGDLAARRPADPPITRRNPDDLQAFSYTAEEQEALRQFYASHGRNGSVLS